YLARSAFLDFAWDRCRVVDYVFPNNLNGETQVHRLRFEHPSEIGGVGPTAIFLFYGALRIDLGAPDAFDKANRQGNDGNVRSVAALINRLKLLDDLINGHLHGFDVMGLLLDLVEPRLRNGRCGPIGDLKFAPKGIAIPKAGEVWM